jgi:phosphoribosylamine--glycine ligase
MRVLVVGGGAREHALAWGLARAPSVREVWSAPGNPGMAALGPRRALAAHDLEGVVDLAVAERFDLVVVGPEVPLVLGLADRLRARGVPCFGPSAAAARLEGSKAFAKTVMARAGVPTAPFAVAASVDETMAAVRSLGLPIVLKADGLAAGKGVRVCYTLEQARAFAWLAQEEGRFGEAGRRLVVETFLVGEEVSVFALAVGERALPLIPARDYKRLGTGDFGPNTGGMGAVAPADLDPHAVAQVVADVVEPVLAALAADGAPYTGLLYCGLMRTAIGSAVLEFNCRFGDPETQAMIPLLASDLGELLLACAQGRLPAAPAWHEGACVAVVLAAAGYPEEPRTGDRVAGLERAAAMEGVQIFHGGTLARGDAIESAGGRVLTVSARGATRGAARGLAYGALAHIRLDGGQCREDVGAEPAEVRGAEGSQWP